LVAHLGLKGDPPERWQDVLFLDTETTGLSGGTGTYVFLIGVAHFAGKELILRQHLLLDLGAERAFIAALKKEIEPFRACASYNGKSFDLPIVRTRFDMAIRSELTIDDSHLDLLHPARRLWRDRFGSTSLKQLEESVLDDGRIADVPGWLIPDAYFHYLRKRDPAIIAPVLEHNARDVISLVRITDRVARAVLAARTGRAPDHAPAAFALARGFERTGAPCWDLFPRYSPAQQRELGITGGGPGTNEERRRAALAKLARRRKNSAGLAAYQGDEPIGFISLGPRYDFSRIEHSRATPPVD